MPGTLDPLDIRGLLMLLIEPDGSGGWQLRSSITSIVSSTSVEVSNDVGNPIPITSSTLATEATLVAANLILTDIFNKLVAGASTEAKQDAANTILASLDARDFAKDATLVSVGNVLVDIFNKLVAGASTEAKQDAANTILASLDAKDYATETTLSDILTQLNLGQLPAANSLAVSLATEQVKDILVVGAAAQSAIGNNILLNVAGVGAIDTINQDTGISTRSFYCQIVATVGISAGQIIFEGSNNNVNFNPITVTDDAIVTGTPIITAQTIASNTVRVYSGKCAYRYLRCRISTGFVGGTIQSFTRYSTSDYIPRITTVAQATNSTLNASISMAAGQTITPSPLTTTGYNSYHKLISLATVNATSVKTTTANVGSINISNTQATPRYFKIYNKAPAPTVGTDVPIFTFYIPANDTIQIDIPAMGLRLTTGLAFAITANAADADNTAIGAGDIITNINYF